MDDPMDGRCAGVTLAGHRCTRRATRPGSDTCASHDPARGVRVATAPRTCRRCGQTQPADHFSASGHGNGRRRVCIRCVRAAEAAKASRRRHPRVNARGEVWCNACQRYLPRDHFKPHPSRPGALWPYCTPCVRIKDRARYHRTKFRPDKAAGAEKRTRRKAARRKVEHRERRRFVLDAVALLGRRGFTRAEIIRLARISWTALRGWERDGCLPTPPVARRFAELLRVTASLPLGDPPPRRRRTPHQAFAAVLAATATLREDYPVRDRWTGGAT